MVGAESAALSASRMSNGGRAQAPLLVSYTPTEMERVNPDSESGSWHGRILLLNHTRKNGVPSRTLTDNLTLRTRPFCALSYGDKESNPWPVSSTGSHPSLSGSAGPLELLRVQEFEMVRASGNAPEPGTDLVRCGV